MTEESRFTAGDCVQLGGTRRIMTVLEVNPENKTAVCSWEDGASAYHFAELDSTRSMMSGRLFGLPPLGLAHGQHHSKSRHPQ